MGNGKKMKLQLLVPVHGEPWADAGPLLDSVAVQQSVDLSEVGVVFASDGEPPAWLSDGSLDRYPFAAEACVQGERGVSAARNLALDHATADYVMFCDADDMLYSVDALYTIFGLIDQKGFDTLVSCFVEEQRTRDVREKMAQGSAILEATFGPQYKAAELPEYIYIPHENDSTFVHGKVHRRQWLVDQGLRFDERLTVHEDSYFNVLCRELAAPDRGVYCPRPFYLWRWRDASVCRHDPLYLLKTYSNMLDTTDALIDQLVRRGYEEKAKALCASSVYETYYTMNKPEWLEETNAEYREAVGAHFREWFAKHRSKWESVDPQVRVVVSEGVRQRQVAEGMLMEAVTVGDWLAGMAGEGE